MSRSPPQSSRMLAGERGGLVGGGARPSREPSGGDSSVESSSTWISSLLRGYTTRAVCFEAVAPTNGGLVVTAEAESSRAEATRGRCRSASSASPSAQLAPRFLRRTQDRKHEVRAVKPVHRQQQEHREVRETQGNLHGGELSTKRRGALSSTCNSLSLVVGWGHPRRKLSHSR